LGYKISEAWWRAHSLTAPGAWVWPRIVPEQA